MIISITYANLRGETGLDAIRSNYFTLAKRLLLVAGAVAVGTRMKGSRRGVTVGNTDAGKRDREDG